MEKFSTLCFNEKISYQEMSRAMYMIDNESFVINAEVFEMLGNLDIEVPGDVLDKLLEKITCIHLQRMN